MNSITCTADIYITICEGTMDEVRSMVAEAKLVLNVDALKAFAEGFFKHTDRVALNKLQRRRFQFFVQRVFGEVALRELCRQHDNRRAQRVHESQRRVEAAYA